MEDSRKANGMLKYRFPVLVRMDLDLYQLPDDPVHASGFFGQDIGVLQLDVIAQVYAVPPRLTSLDGTDGYSGNTL
jgi:hypothetical protein